jgi:hypothetical protein
MKKILIFITVAFFCSCSAKSDKDRKDENYESLKQVFLNPPAQARPKVYWWWLNGNTDTLRLKAEIRAMKEAGISGFDIFEIGVPRSDETIKAGPAFLSRESLAAIKLVIDEAGKAGMTAGLNMASSWNAGGSWIKPVHAAKSIYYSKTVLDDKSENRIKLPFPEILKPGGTGMQRMIPMTSSGKPVYYEEVAVIAIPSGVSDGKLDTGRIFNISRYFDPSEEILDWDSPPGKWEVYRYVCSNSGEQLKLPSLNSAGPIIDHFDSTATAEHFMHVINLLKPVLGDFRKTALKSLYLASYEATGFVWTSTLPSEFRKINGYDICKFIPALFDKKLYNENLIGKFQSDFRRTLSEMMIRNFYGKAREIANRYGLMINSEAGGPGLPLHNVPVEPLKALGALDLPRGEFWINHSRYKEQGIDIMRVVKEVSAASHIYNRGIVEDESFTSFQHWQEGPFDMKPYGDRAFCEGLNRVVIHGFSHNPEGYGYPGIVYHAGTHFNDRRVWWTKVKPFNDYLARLCAVFQNSWFFADVLYYYGDAVPNYAGPKNGRFTAGPGYDYEVVNTDILKMITVKNRKLVLPGGAEFSILAVEREKEMNPDISQKINELTKQGAIITGIEGETGSPREILQALGIPPDIDYNDKELGTIDFIHYRKGTCDIYFIRNTVGKWISRNCSFRQKNKVPEFWDPVSGGIAPVHIYNQSGNFICIPVTLAPFESRIIIFRNSLPASHFMSVRSVGQDPPLMSFTKDGILFHENGIYSLEGEGHTLEVNNMTRLQYLSGAWEVTFLQGLGAPPVAIFPELISWTKSENDGIKYFSGIAAYEKTFSYDPGTDYGADSRIFLDLGNISKIGEVWLNGGSLGITWSKPYRFDVTGMLKRGENKLKIEIANTWSNRLTGDAIKGEKYTNTNIRTTNIDGLNTKQVPWAQVPLIESGLLGPVTLISGKQIMVID